MKIIDKHTDFYDYMQKVFPDDLVTFDRRDSYILTKEDFAKSFDMLKYSVNYTNNKHQKKRISDSRYLTLLQVCNTFWLFCVDITQMNSYGMGTDYNIYLARKWVDYDAPKRLITLSTISFGRMLLRGDEEFNSPVMGEKLVDKFVNAVHRGDYEIDKSYNTYTFAVNKRGRTTWEQKHIPILREIGVAGFIDAKDIYFALDEYFSSERTANEKTEADGTTNESKIVSHGFDLKTSFRGKNKSTTLS